MTRPDLIFWEKICSDKCKKKFTQRQVYGRAAIMHNSGRQCRGVRIRLPLHAHPAGAGYGVHMVFCGTGGGHALPQEPVHNSPLSAPETAGFFYQRFRSQRRMSMTDSCEGSLQRDGKTRSRSPRLHATARGILPEACQAA